MKIRKEKLSVVNFEGDINNPEKIAFYVRDEWNCDEQGNDNVYFCEIDQEELLNALDDGGYIEYYDTSFVYVEKNIGVEYGSVEVDTVPVNFLDFWQDLDMRFKEEVLIEYFFQQLALDFPKKPISTEDFLKLCSWQQQQYIKWIGINLSDFKYKWLKSFYYFATGKSPRFAHILGQELLNIAFLFRSCLPDGELERLNKDFWQKDIEVRTGKKVA